MLRLHPVLLGAVSWAAIGLGSAQGQPASTLNPYILRVIASIDRPADQGGRKLGGYNLQKAFTQDLRYGLDADNCCIQASRPKAKDPGPNPTMCVAGTAEILAEAVALYAKEHPALAAKIYKDLPRSSWTSGNLRSLRANMFMYKGTGSLGTAFALQRAGVGREKLFDAMVPGDVMNFNRTGGTGHAVIFMGYITPAGPTKTYASNVNGFRYYSAQGSGRPDGGFGYRNAYFSGSCPSPRGRDDDCNVIRSFGVVNGQKKQNKALLNTGEMLAPEKWDVAAAKAKLEAQVTRGFEDEGLTRGAGLEVAVARRLDEELEPNLAAYADGSEGP